MQNHIIERLKKKAIRSDCNYRVSAVAFDKKGDILGYSHNIHRFNRYGGGVHAEQKLMRQYKDNIKTIIICRTNKSGEILPIQPCEVCKRIADKNGITIVSINKE